MSKLAEYRALEAQMAEQLKQLEALKNDGQLQQEIEFENKLRALLGEYGYSLRNIISLLDPKAGAVSGISLGRGKRRERVLKVYKNPHTGEVVETKGGNNKILKAWKEKFGVEVNGWVQ